MAKRIIPQGGRLLVKPLPVEDVTLGSITLPGGGSGELKEGISATDLELIDPSKGVHFVVKAGDKLLYPLGAAVGQLVNGDWCDWITINDVWAIVEETQANGDAKPVARLEDKGDNL